MHRLSPGFVLGYHGCDRVVARKLIDGSEPIKSQNDYDWLGSGFYLWESNSRRGLEWAEYLAKRKETPIKKPAVVGAIVDLRQCLDLTTASGIAQVSSAHRQLHILMAEAGQPMPKNSSNLLARRLDCAVINTLHDVRRMENKTPVDTVRGVFVEGEPVYQSSGFFQKTHIQICVCNLDCIRGFFRVPQSDLA